jgi:hypothetical protein
MAKNTNKISHKLNPKNPVLNAVLKFIPSLDFLK